MVDANYTLNKVINLKRNVNNMYMFKYYMNNCVKCSFMKFYILNYYRIIKLTQY